jgi:hypothetical protein
MSASRESIEYRVSELLGGRPVRWATAESTIGDYDGRERTLEVFLADATEQRALVRVIRPQRAELEDAAGGPIITIFHTRAETRRLYPEMLSPLGMVVSALRSEFPFVRGTVREPSPPGLHVLDLSAGVRRFEISWCDEDGFAVHHAREDGPGREPAELCPPTLARTIQAARWLVRRAAPVDVLTAPTQPPLRREAA